jgi:predicted KAP-like P-loop ATPase
MGDCLEEARIEDSEKKISYGIYKLEPLTALLNELNEKGD